MVGDVCYKEVGSKQQQQLQQQQQQRLFIRLMKPPSPPSPFPQRGTRLSRAKLGRPLEHQTSLEGVGNGGGCSYHFLFLIKRALVVLSGVFPDGGAPPCFLLTANMLASANQCHLWRRYLQCFYCCQPE